MLFECKSVLNSYMAYTRLNFCGIFSLSACKVIVQKHERMHTCVGVHYTRVYAYTVNFGDGNWRQVEAWIVLLVGAVEVNAVVQGSTAIHSIAMDRSPNLPVERRTLYHWDIAAMHTVYALAKIRVPRAGHTLLIRWKTRINHLQYVQYLWKLFSQVLVYFDKEKKRKTV